MTSPTVRSRAPRTAWTGLDSSHGTGSAQPMRSPSNRPSQCSPTTAANSSPSSPSSEPVLRSGADRPAVPIVCLPSARIGTNCTSKSSLDHTRPGVNHASIVLPLDRKERPVRVALLSREYPPDVYGGAGVHVEYLARELAKLVDLQVHCFGEPRPSGPPGSPEVIAHPTWDALEGSGRHLSALRTVATDLSIAAGVEGAELVHSQDRK